MVRPRRQQVAAFCGIVAAAGAILSGCAGYSFGPVGDPVGLWVSERNDAALIFNSDGTGEFTLCEPDDRYYNYEAEDWPSSIPITWHMLTGQYTAHQVEFFKDVEVNRSPGVGFRTRNKILGWDGGNLEMGMDSTSVIFTKVDVDTFECPEG